MYCYFLRSRLEVRAKKIIFGENNCIDDCSLTSNNQYEFKGECYHQCPENTTNSNYKCYPYEEVCNPNCKACTIINTNLDTNCTSCYSDKYLKYGNCVD